MPAHAFRVVSVTVHGYPDAEADDTPNEAALSVHAPDRRQFSTHSLSSPLQQRYASITMRLRSSIVSGWTSSFVCPTGEKPIFW